MPRFNMHEAKTRLSELVQMAENGEEVIIARNGKPAVKLVEIKPEIVEAEKPEPKLRGAWGAMQGKIWIAPDFDDDEELIDLFYADNLFPEDAQADKSDK